MNNSSFILNVSACELLGSCPVEVPEHIPLLPMEYKMFLLAFFGGLALVDVIFRWRYNHES